MEKNKSNGINRVKKGNFNGKILYGLRQIHGYSLEEVETKTGINASAVGKLETGENKQPHPKNLLRLSRLFNVAPDIFFQIELANMLVNNVKNDTWKKDSKSFHKVGK